MSTVPTPTHLAPTDYARGLIDGQVDILELLDSAEDPKTLIAALLKNARQRAAELHEAAR